MFWVMIIWKQIEDKHNINVFYYIYHNTAIFSRKWPPLLLFKIVLNWLLAKVFF